MKSDEIRLMKMKSLGRIEETLLSDKGPLIEVEKFQVLAEIAYQLAKLNEHFEIVDKSVFGGVNAKKEKIKE